MDVLALVVVVALVVAAVKGFQYLMSICPVEVPVQQMGETAGWSAPGYVAPQPQPLTELEWEFGGGNANNPSVLIERQERIRRRANNPKHN